MVPKKVVWYFQFSVPRALVIVGSLSVPASRRVRRRRRPESDPMLRDGVPKIPLMPCFTVSYFHFAMDSPEIGQLYARPRPADGNFCSAPLDFRFLAAGGDLPGKWYFYHQKVVFTTCRFPSPRCARFPRTRIPVNLKHWHAAPTRRCPVGRAPASTAAAWPVRHGGIWAGPWWSSTARRPRRRQLRLTSRLLCWQPVGRVRRALPRDGETLAALHVGLCTMSRTHQSRREVLRLTTEWRVGRSSRGRTTRGLHEVYTRGLHHAWSTREVATRECQFMTCSQRRRLSTARDALFCPVAPVASPPLSRFGCSRGSTGTSWCASAEMSRSVIARENDTADGSRSHAPQ
jgi:hypothetical protein